MCIDPTAVKFGLWMGALPLSLWNLRLSGQGWVMLHFPVDIYCYSHEKSVSSLKSYWLDTSLILVVL